MGGLQTAHSSVIGDALKVGFQNFVDQSATRIATTATGSPAAGYFHSTIVGRAPIPDISNDLRVSGGNERIATQAIVQLQNEFGPNGEPVYAAVNDDRGLIRCVGPWVGSPTSNQTYGQYLGGSQGDYVEIVFYGTGLNLLSIVFLAQDIRITVDGGTEGSNIWPSSPSNVLGGRNYSSNAIVPIVAGLTLGVHTVKIKAYNSSGMYVSGFEILNSNASGLLNINTGTAYIQGQKVLNSVADSLAYKPAALTGTKGGRVVQYLNQDGSVNPAVTLVDSSILTLTNTNHTNEEVVRVYNWRDFGCGRTAAGDDFSAQSLGSPYVKAFTLDDGTTTLAGTNMNIATNYLSQADSALDWFVIFTFVGTGIDIAFTELTNARTSTVSIDGGTPLTLVQGTASYKVHKIASGLAYGTHTVKVNSPYPGVGGLPPPHRPYSFTVYQPKKPTIPATAVELGDYNVLADLVANTTAGVDTISQGVLRKEISQREAVYVGAGWTLPSAVYPSTAVGGWQAYTGTVGQYVEYTFFGTGFEKRCYSTAGATFTVQVDGAFPAAVTYYGGYNSYTPATGALTANVGTVASGFRVVGLSLGVHKVKVALASGTYLYTEAMDIITPIHSTKSNLYADLQNTLPVGSCSLTDSRKTTALLSSMSTPKAWAQAVGTSKSPEATTTSTTLVPCPDMSLTIKTSGGSLKIDFSLNVAFSSGAELNWAIYVDGVKSMDTKNVAPLTTGYFVFTDSFIIPVASGVHKVDVYWASGGGQTLTLRSPQRNLTAQEL